MSISGAAEGLTDLINEYESSIGDSDVTIEDHHAIAKDMKDWIEKIHSYTSYMSDIITAVKGQAVTLSENQTDSFTIDELFKRVNILMKHEIKKACLTLETELNLPDTTALHGDVNSLVQVINNLITNAIQSYNGKTGEVVKLTASKNGTNLIISVIDTGSGISPAVKNKLFKSMITTKGKNGTGLGLFMSYSTIKGNFNGNITFDSELGKGTTFNIIIPIND
jgi:signal transduction histidine kinase